MTPKEIEKLKKDIKTINETASVYDLILMGSKCLTKGLRLGLLLGLSSGGIIGFLLAWKIYA